MEKSSDSPGVFIPPPLFYAAVFALSVLIQNRIPIQSSFLQGTAGTVIGLVCIITGLVFAAPALRQFVMTKNTVVLIKPASSLQTGGIYARSRNPMYIGLLFLYIGLALRFGNSWTFLLLPVLILLITRLVIIPEEKYLLRAFGSLYTDYKKKVPRWL